MASDSPAVVWPLLFTAGAATPAVHRHTVVAAPRLES